MTKLEALVDVLYRTGVVRPDADREVVTNIARQVLIDHGLEDQLYDFYED